MADTKLTLELLEGQTAYRPGDTIEGVAGWELEKPIKKIEVHLCWHTEGRGNEDDSAVDTVTFENPQPVDAQIFSFTAPNGPYSYDGHLIAIKWTVELTGRGIKAVERLNITISPTGSDVTLQS